MLKEGGEYAPVGDRCYLVQYAAIQCTCLGSAEVEELTPWYPPGNTEVLTVRALPGKSWWALVKTGKLSGGVVSEAYCALVATRVGGKISVKGHSLAWSESPIGEEEYKVCRDGSLKVASGILSYDISGNRAGEHVSFEILQTDCRSGRTQRLTER